MFASPKQSGFTLIEMLVSLSLFTVVITITVGSLLVLINGNRELVSTQSVMDSLSFSLDSMTREIRTGRSYVCVSASGQNSLVGTPPEYSPIFPGSDRRFFNDSLSDHDSIGNHSRDCVAGRPSDSTGNLHGVSVIEGGSSVTGTGSTRILYYYRAGSGATPGTIMRRVGNGTAQPIFSSDIDVTEANFYVTDSQSLNAGGNERQPTVTILLTATDITNPAQSISLQTTITQRELDL